MDSDIQTGSFVLSLQRTFVENIAARSIEILLHCIEEGAEATHIVEATVQGWIRAILPEDAELAKRYLPLIEQSQYHWEMI